MQEQLRIYAEENEERKGGETRGEGSKVEAVSYVEVDSCLEDMWGGSRQAREKRWESAE